MAPIYAEAEAEESEEAKALKITTVNQGVAIGLLLVAFGLGVVREYDWQNVGYGVAFAGCYCILMSFAYGMDRLLKELRSIKDSRKD